MNYQYDYQEEDLFDLKNDRGTGDTEYRGADNFSSFLSQPQLDKQCPFFYNTGDDDDCLIDLGKQNQYQKPIFEGQGIAQMSQDDQQSSERNSFSNKQQNITQGNTVSQSQKRTFWDSSEEQQLQVEEYQNGYKLSKKWRTKTKKIFKCEKVKQFSQSHNRNMPKFLAAKFSKFYKEYTKPEAVDECLINKIDDFCSKKEVKIKDLAEIVGGQNSKSRRQFLSKILREKLDKEVIKNPNVKEKNRMAHLLCSKVYALRCRSNDLIGRLVSK